MIKSTYIYFIFGYDMGLLLPGSWKKSSYQKKKMLDYFIMIYATAQEKLCIDENRKCQSMGAPCKLAQQLSI